VLAHNAELRQQFIALYTQPPYRLDGKNNLAAKRLNTGTPREISKLDFQAYRAAPAIHLSQRSATEFFKVSLDERLSANELIYQNRCSRPASDTKLQVTDRLASE
jgi:hypothetical protein